MLLFGCLFGFIFIMGWEVDVWEVGVVVGVGVLFCGVGLVMIDLMFNLMLLICW